MDKSPEAFRTISEVADWLDVPTHVLRFWESRFSQVKPVKRAGGRRYYRPADMRLIGGIKRLLHDDGMTIRSVQKLLREEGVKHVAQFSQPLDHEKSEAHEASIFAPEPEDVAAPTPPEVADQFPVSDDEELADAAWENVPEPADMADGSLPPAPSDAEVVAFGSVRSRTEEAEAPLEEAPDAVAEMPEPDATEPEQPDFLDQDVAAAAPPPPRAVPIVANAPEVDPEDDAEGHTRPASSTSRILTMDPALLRKDPIKIEQVVAALRAVRDRSSR